MRLRDPWKLVVLRAQRSLKDPCKWLRRPFSAAAIPFLALVVCHQGAAQAPAATLKETAKQALTPTRTGYANVKGGRIYYQVHGDLSSAKTPLLVLHGSFMSADSMWPIVEPFAASRPVIATDARGHGRSGDAGALTQELLADDAVAVLNAFERVARRRVVYSMGVPRLVSRTHRIKSEANHPGRSSAPRRWYPEVIQMANRRPRIA